MCSEALLADIYCSALYACCVYVHAGGVGILSYGFYHLSENTRRRNAQKQERREARLCILPFLEAEADALAVYSKRSALKGTVLDNRLHTLHAHLLASFALYKLSCETATP